MTTLSIGVTAYSVQSAKPGTQFGQLAKIPLKGGASGSAVMYQASLAKIPKGATITSAVIRFQASGAQTGTFTLQHYATTTKWPTDKTWSKRPTRSAVIASTSVTNPTNGQVIDVPVTAQVQARVSGTATDFGWYADISQTGVTLNVRGTSAASGRPQLIVTYTVAPPVPSNLQPADASVATGKPVLLFDADPNITALQVQVDPAANGTTPAYDSGQQAATGGLWDLSATAYAGLAAGASTYWRVQQWTTGGPSGWSPWVQFSRVTAETLTITSPSGAAPVAVQDGTPPITWTFSGTPTAWQVRLLSMTGAVIADSRRQSGTDTSWTPPKGLTTAGTHGLIEVTVWPGGNRAATPGVPVESIATLEVVLTPSGALEQFVSVGAGNTGMSPTVTITGYRSAIPDFVALLRDGAEVGRWVGTDVCAPAAGGGYTATVFDTAPNVNRSTVYTIVAVVNGVQSSHTSTVTMTPRCRGIWLTDADGNQAVLWGNDDAAQTQPEIAVVHQPIGEDNGDAPAVVRRRLLRAKDQGTISGQVMDVGPYDAATTEANLRSWAEEGDAGDLYQLVLGWFTGQVIIGDVIFSEINSSPANGRMLQVTANWWAQ